MKVQTKLVIMMALIFGSFIIFFVLDLQHHRELLTYNGEREMLMSVYEHANRHIFSFLIYIAGVLTVILLLLLKWIAKPLKQVEDSLLFESVAPLENLSLKHTEFGQMARFIKRFFEQRDELQREITERKNAEEMLKRSEEQYRLLIENSSDLIYSATPHGIVTYISPNIKSFGYREDEVLGHSVAEFVYPEDRQRVVDGFAESIATGRENPVSFRLLTRNGGMIHAEEFGKPLRNDGQVICLTGVIRDVTKRVLAEEQLKQAKDELQNINEHLEELVRKRTDELMRAQEKLIRSEKLAFVGQIASSVSHDLRSPLTAIKNTAYILKARGIGKENPENAHSIDVISKEVDACTRIIGDVLDFVRTKEPVKAKANLASIIEESISLTNIPESVKLRIDTGQELPELSIDALQIRQVFDNLIKNAINSMEGGGTLSIKSYKHESSAIIEFQDTGCGIARENLEKIFEPLFSTFKRGTGLGLCVCQRIVEAHGGTIEVESEVGKGTMFRIKLPL